jgi:hypothetical protein
MPDTLARLNGEQVVGLLMGMTAIVSGLLIVLVAVAITQWRWAREARLRADLLKEMLHRGLTVEDIERLLRQTPGEPSPAAGQTDSDIVAQVALSLAGTVDPSQMEAALRALRTAGPETRRAVRDAVAGMVEQEVDGQIIVAAIQSLCAPADRAGDVRVVERPLEIG